MREARNSTPIIVVRSDPGLQSNSKCAMGASRSRPIGPLLGHRRYAIEAGESVAHQELGAGPRKFEGGFGC